MVDRFTKHEKNVSDRAACQVEEGYECVDSNAAKLEDRRFQVACQYCNSYSPAGDERRSTAERSEAALSEYQRIGGIIEEEGSCGYSYFPGD